MPSKLFRTVSRQRHSNSFASETENRRFLNRSSSASSVTEPLDQEYGGILEKQKASMRTWAKRYCWIKDGRMLWAEIKKDGSMKEKGFLYLRDVLNVERGAESPDRKIFIVRTEDRVINFGAETDDDVTVWVDLLNGKPTTEPEQPPEEPHVEDDDDDERGQILKRFPARFVKSEEVVVTVRSNLSMEVSKYVGGGFRLRLDEVQRDKTWTLDPLQARALGLPSDTNKSAQCVVARGDRPWSAAETDSGSCVLALCDDESQRSWQDLLDVDRSAVASAAPHCRLAGWKLPDKWWLLFGSNLAAFEGDHRCSSSSSSENALEARNFVTALERWLATTKLPRTDDLLRFPTRYGLPVFKDDLSIFVNVAVFKQGRRTTGVHNVRCQAKATVAQFAAEVARKIVDEGEKNKTTILQDVLEKLLDDDQQQKKKPRWVFRVAGIRSYLVLRDAPLVASHDVVAALRLCTSEKMTVNLILECGLDDSEASALETASKSLTTWYGTFDTALFPVDQTAAALRAKPPNVSKLAMMPDAMMEPYIPQLVQSLKAEDLADFEDSDFPAARDVGEDTKMDSDVVVSELMKFLLERGLRNPTFVGSSLFWALRCEMSKGGRTAVRHGAMLAAYLGAVGTRARAELEKQVVLDAQLRWITASCGNFEDKHARNVFARRELRRLARSGELPAGMDLPCMPGRRAGRVRPDKCKVLSSKAAPLILIFDDAEFPGNPDGRELIVIFKTRDDLRQDAAMLQAMRQMDALWLQAGIECWLRTYRVTATDVDVGWIEVVRDAKETSEIQSVWGSGTIGGAFQNNTLHNYLAEHNKGDAFKAACDRFVASCAACCVATYVLGIADRHNGNIMLHRSGNLFHIDFGHVLGNFKKIKAINVKRERTNIVLTPEMMFVINGGKNVAMNDDFVHRCKLLIDILNGRGNGSLLHTLLLQLVPADLPEISSDSINWLPNILLNNDIVAELNAALNDKFRRIDNSIHNRIHQPSPSSAKKTAPAVSVASSDSAKEGAHRVTTISEAHHEIEELRRLLSAAEAEKRSMADQIVALQHQLNAGTITL